MNKVVLSVVAALAVSAAVPAFAADMPVKAVKAPVVAPSPWDVAFGTAFTTNYELRGISQSNKLPAAQGYFEVDYTANDWLKLYAGLWGSSLASYNADAEFYAKPSYKFNDWLTIGATFDGGNNFNDGYLIVGSTTAYYYSGNATITLPVKLPYGIVVSINPELGRQVFDCTGCTSYTYWDVGIDFNYKAVTLDLRYWDTNAHGVFVSPVAFGAKDLAGSTFVATLKFDTTLSALK
jgi:hypothetical protein